MSDGDFVDIEPIEEEVEDDFRAIGTCSVDDATKSVSEQALNKCLICGKETAERTSVLSRGLPTFLQLCQSAHRNDLVEIIESHREKQLVLLD